jgi:hypothetical protein
MDAVVAALRALADQRRTPSADQLGEALMSIVAIAAERDLNAEDALRLAIGRYRDAVAAKEAGR